ncbi:MAG: putative integral membrane protein [Colwellia sp.]|jgi:uncharacterized integral membrane protein
MYTLILLVITIFVIQIQGYVEVSRMPNNLKEWVTLLGLLSLIVTGVALKLLRAKSNPTEE